MGQKFQKNNKKMVFIIISDSLSGGAGTLSFRMGKWLTDKNYEVILFCKKNDNVEIFNSMISAGVSVKCLKNRERVAYLKKYESTTKFIAISYFLKNFLEIEILKKDFFIVKNWLYVVHLRALIWGDFSLSVIRKYFVGKFREIITRLDDNDSIIFMDNKSLDFTERYYNIEIKNKDQKIIRIPMFIDKPKQKVSNKNELNTFNILTIGRADFPFKGYILGLIDDFVEINQKYTNTKLIIISYGREIARIEEVLKSIDKNVKANIQLIKGVPNDKLDDYYQNAHLYIGMGTTILEAGINTVPSIIAKSYTVQNLTCGYFHKNKKNIGVPVDVELPSKPFIEEVINMDFVDYQDISLKSYEAVEELYNIDMNIRKFISSETKNETLILNNNQIWFSKTYYLAGQLVVRLRKSKRIIQFGIRRFRRKYF